MADDNGQQKSEAPSQARRDRARRKGQTPHSADLTNGLILLAGVLALWLGGDSIGSVILEQVRGTLAGLQATEWGTAESMRAAVGLLSALGAAVGVVAAVTALAAIVANVAQSGGFSLATDAFEVDWQKLSPLSGWKRIVSLKGAVRGLSAMIKVAVFLPLVWWMVRSRGLDIATLGWLTLPQAVRWTWEMVIHVSLAVAVSLVVIGLADYLFQRWKHEEDLKVTKEEAKRDRKEEDGDPEIRARIRRLQRERAQQQVAGRVKESTVVVKNPTHFAVALKYDRLTMRAPVVTAKGADAMAHQIVRVAQQHGVPVVERIPVARALFQMVEVDQEIPLELYQAVVEILLFVNRLKV